MLTSLVDQGWSLVAWSIPRALQALEYLGRRQVEDLVEAWVLEVLEDYSTNNSNKELVVLTMVLFLVDQEQ